MVKYAVCGRIFALMLLFTCGKTLFSAPAEAPYKWYRSLVDGDYPTVYIMQKIAFITSVNDGVPSFFELSAAEFSEGCFWQLIVATETGYARIMNTRPFANDYEWVRRGSPEEVFREIFTTTLADTVVFAPKNEERWTVYVKGKDGAPERAFVAKKPDSTDAKTVKAWLQQKVGYSGVVLDQKGKFLLVGINREMPENSQALLFAESSTLLRIKMDDAEGGALLRRVLCEKNLCTYEKMINAEKSTSIGEKVIF